MGEVEQAANSATAIVPATIRAALGVTRRMRQSSDGFGCERHCGSASDLKDCKGGPSVTAACGAHVTQVTRAGFSVRLEVPLREQQLGVEDRRTSRSADGVVAQSHK